MKSSKSPRRESSAKLIFFGPPFAPSAAGASPTAPVETTAGRGRDRRSTAGSAIQTGRAVPAGRVFSRLESPRLESPASAGAARRRRAVGALNAAGRSDANMSFIAGAALFCDCGGGRSRRSSATAAKALAARRARGGGRRLSPLDSPAPPRRSPRRLSRRLSSRVAPRPAGRRPRRSAPWRRPRGRRATELSSPAPARSPPRPRRRRAPSPGSRLTAKRRGAAARAGRGRLLFLSFPFPNGGGVFTVFTRGCIAGGSLRAPRRRLRGGGGGLRQRRREPSSLGGRDLADLAGGSFSDVRNRRWFVRLSARLIDHTRVRRFIDLQFRVGDGGERPGAPQQKRRRVLAASRRLRARRRDCARAETRLLRVSSERLRSRGGTSARNLHQRRCFVCFFLSVVGRVGVASSRRSRSLVFFVFSAHAHAHVVRVARVGSRAGPDDGAVLLHARACRVELALRVDLLRRAREHARGDDPLRVETPGGNGSERRVASVFAGGCPRAPRGAVAARGRGDSWGAKRGGAHPLDLVRARQHRRIGVALAQPRPQ